MRKYFVILSLLLYVLPTQAQRRFSGLYCTPPDNYDNNCLRFLSDSTCIYSESSCITNINVEGKYKIVRDSLTIFFACDTARGNMMIQKKRKTTADSVTIHLKVYRLKTGMKVHYANISFKAKTTRRFHNVKVDSSGATVFRVPRNDEPLHLSAWSVNLISYDFDIVPEADFTISVYMAEPVYRVGFRYDEPKRYKILYTDENTVRLSQKIKDNIYIYNFNKR